MITRRGARSALCCSALSVLLAAGSAAAAPAPPGLTRAARVQLDAEGQLSQPGVAVQRDGTAYVAWVSDPGQAGQAQRELRVCTLTAVGGCAHLARIPSLGPSTAADVHVFTPSPGSVVVAWYHEVEGTPTPRDGRIAVATSGDGGATFTPARDLGDAPATGQLLDAQLRDGTLWTVTHSVSQSFTTVEVRATPLATTTLATAAAVVAFGRPSGPVQLALDPHGPLLVAAEYGSVTAPLEVAHAAASADPSASASWTAGAAVRGALSPSFDLVPVAGGTRLVGYSTSVQGALVTLPWRGSSFGAPASTGYRHPCPDLAMGTAGRGAPASTYTSFECQRVAVGNLADGVQTAVGTFPAGGTPSRTPALAASPRGTGVAVWALSTSSPAGESLFAQRVVVPIVLRAVVAASPAGSLTLTAPVGCVPPTSATLRASARAPRGSSLSGPLVIGVDGRTTTGSTRVLDASRWTAGSRHTLTVTATVRSTGAHGTTRRTLRLQRTVTSCG